MTRFMCPNLFGCVLLLYVQSPKLPSIMIEVLGSISYGMIRLGIELAGSGWAEGSV